VPAHRLQGKAKALSRCLLKILQMPVIVAAGNKFRQSRLRRQPRMDDHFGSMDDPDSVYLPENRVSNRMPSPPKSMLSVGARLWDSPEVQERGDSLHGLALWVTRRSVAGTKNYHFLEMP
jgi:hypothetical protein